MWITLVTSEHHTLPSAPPVPQLPAACMEAGWFMLSPEGAVREYPGAPWSWVGGLLFVTPRAGVCAWLRS